MHGEVVGITSSIRTASAGGPFGGGEGGSIGLGFAIPIDNVWPIVQQLRDGQTPTHARLGVSVTDASSSNGLLTGAGIEQVNPGSAGEKAGLVRGDVVVKVDDEQITGAESLVATIRGHRPGDTVELTVVCKGNQRHTVEVTLDSDGGTASSSPPPLRSPAGPPTSPGKGGPAGCFGWRRTHSVPFCCPGAQKQQSGTYCAAGPVDRISRVRRPAAARPSRRTRRTPRPPPSGP
jgi:membrane-associated protease RseP (regulator of RpoE activity)